MTLEKPSVSVWRVVLAFLVAPLPVAFVFAGVGMGTEPMGMTHRFFSIAVLGLMFLAYPCELLLALPAYLYLKRRLRPTLLNCAIVGVVITVLPWLAFSLLPMSNAEFGNLHFTIQDGHRTTWGWLDLANSLGEVAAMGAVTGAVFWVVAAAGIKSPKRSDIDAQSIPPLG